MKTYKHEGFYEDEESLKMMEIINKQAEQSRVEKIKTQKKEQKEDLFTKVFVLISCAFMITCLIYMSNKKYEKDVKTCVNSGFEESYCRYELTK